MAGALLAILPQGSHLTRGLKEGAGQPHLPAACIYPTLAPERLCKGCVELQGRAWLCLWLLSWCWGCISSRLPAPSTGVPPLACQAVAHCWAAALRNPSPDSVSCRPVYSAVSRISQPSLAGFQSPESCRGFAGCPGTGCVVSAVCTSSAEQGGGARDTSAMTGLLFYSHGPCPAPGSWAGNSLASAGSPGAC